ncbi:MAG: Gldg family protein [Pseudomonadota bacterium]
MRLKVIREVAGKELALFFGSAIAYLFLAAFLAATLFIFFWGEAFFARNIADVRPLFEWLPVLLIFLSAALTMRMWSEERRTGTLEYVATLPVSTAEFVLGKFLACWSLLCIALLLTLPLPISVALLADLDWGPVVAGYVAALLLGGAYISVGLFVSARTDSQIVSLIIASAVCGAFYLIGSDTISGLFGAPIQDLLLALGSGARFDDITRGVLDLRDLYFYVSVLLVFLVLNGYALEHQKWAADGDRQRHRAWRLSAVLVVANLLLVNVWLHHVNVLRIDMTQGQIYSISSATRGYLGQLREPLLIRGYFTAKTHPLLAPLVPRMKDLLREYEVAGGGQVRVEIVDPADNPDLENEANTKYGIRAVPFQVADRHQASLVNSYFDVLVQYGDEYEVLGFRDLIEVKVEGETSLDVQLKNPEFDVTRAIKQVLYGFQGGNSIFANINDPVEFVGYVSADSQLPEALVGLRQSLTEVVAELAAEADGRFTHRVVDPQAAGGEVAQQIADEYGFQPMAASLFDSNTFYFYLTLQRDNVVVRVPIPEDLTAAGLKRGIDAGLKRFASGLLKNVVLTAPAPVTPQQQQMGMPPGNNFTQLQSFLTSDFNVTVDNLTSGMVPAEADLLMVVDPQMFSQRQLFAVDQFLMKGGTVVLATGAYGVQFGADGLTAAPRQSGLQEWLAHHGVEIAQALVMDPQNAAFPVPVTREVGGFSFQDLVMLDYPYFVDVRGSGLNEDSPILAGIPQLTVSWPSPIEVTPATSVKLTTLLSSTPESWVSADSNVMPRFDDQGLSAFVPEPPLQQSDIGVALQGRFASYYTDKNSPLLSTDDQTDVTENAESADSSEQDGLGVVSSVITQSPESARLLVFSSNDFLADQTLQMIGSADGTVYANSVQMMANVVDWALEDQNLIGIRARGNFNRTLPGMEVGEQSFVEYVNYGLALLGVLLVLVIYRARLRLRQQQHQRWLVAGESV